MTRYIPQYAKSTDPEVIATIKDNEARAKEARERAHAFQERYGDDADGQIFISAHAGGVRLAGVLAKEKPTAGGRWKVGRRHGVWEPWRNNELRAEFDSIASAGVIPKGLDRFYVTGYRDGSTIMHTPQTFVHDGVAYMALGSAPLADQSAGWGDGVFDDTVWTEALGSEIHAALDAYSERRKAEAR